MKGLITLLMAACLTFINPFASYAQVNRDSLNRVYKDTTLSDSLRLDAIDRLAFSIHKSNPDSALRLALVEYSYATSIGSEHFSLSSLSRLGDIYFDLDSVEKLEWTVHRREEVLKEYPAQPAYRMMRLHRDKGRIMLENGNPAEALDEFVAACCAIRDYPRDRIPRVRNLIALAVCSAERPDSLFKMYKHGILECEVQESRGAGRAFLDIYYSCRDTLDLELQRSALITSRAYAISSKYPWLEVKSLLNLVSVFHELRKKAEIEDLPDMPKQAVHYADSSYHYLVKLFEILHSNYRYTRFIGSGVDGNEKAYISALQYRLDGELTVWKVDSLIKSLEIDSILPWIYQEITLEFRKTKGFATVFEFAKRWITHSYTYGDDRTRVHAFEAMSGIYAAIKDQESQEKYTLLTISLADSLNYKFGKAKGLSRLGLLVTSRGDYDQALNHYQEALRIYEELENETAQGSVRSRIANLYKYKKEYRKSLEAFETNLELYRSIDNDNGIAWMLVYMGEVYELLNEYQNAIAVCEQAEPLMQKIDHLRGQKKVCNCLADLYYYEGRYKDAYDQIELYLAYDTEMNLESTEQQAVQWEFEKERLTDSLEQVQERGRIELTYQAEVASQKQQRNIYLLGALVALFAAAFLTMRLRYSRKQRIMLEAEKKREQAEAVRLQELDKLKTDLYTNITHEFRTPLTVISGMVAELKDHPDKMTEVSTIVQRNTSVLLNLVTQMLDLSKVESGNLDVNSISGDVVEYIGYITQSFQSMAATKDISLHVINKDESMVMDYDPDKLMQILSNLLSNSIKFTPGGGNIYVTTSSNGALEVEVRDTGVGIAEEDLPHVFDRFYQVADTENKSLVGTGIGLALTKQLVDLMGGTISASSVTGKGTTFHVSLPVTRESENIDIDFDPESVRDVAYVFAAGTIAQKPVAGVVPSLRVLPRLLIIEDNPDVQHYLQTILENHYKITLAPDGKQGIDTALEMIPDIVITDVMMPEKDGFQVCDELKSNERTNHIPIVMLTAKADADSRIEGLRTGADAYLAKPFNKEELLIRLKKLLQLRRTLHARYTSGAPIEVAKETELQDEFIIKLNTFVHDHMADSNFSTASVCREMGMSRSTLHKKVKALTGRSTSLYIRFLRVQHGKTLLRTTDLNVSEVAYDVGFSDPAYFSKCFSEEFGMPPSAFKQ